MDHEACDRGRLFVRQMPIHGAVEVADRHRTVDNYGAVGLGPDTGHHDVVLVGNIADDLFQNVFQRHHAFDFAVLVDYQREVSLAATEGLELFGNGTHLRHEPGRQHNGRDVDLGRVAVCGANGAQQVLGVQDADDVFRLL